MVPMARIAAWGGIDDRVEVPDAEGTKIRDRDRASLHFGRGQFFVT
jgi:hypothetical protein